VSQDPHGNQPYDPTGYQPQHYDVNPPGPYDPSTPPQQVPNDQAGGYYQQGANQYDPYQYAAPAYGVRNIAPVPQNGLGVAALVLGIIAVVLSPCCYMIFTAPTGILAVIFGAIGVQKAGRGEATNKGVAMAGLICGIVGLALGVLMLLMVIVFGMWDAQMSL